MSRMAKAIIVAVAVLAAAAPAAGAGNGDDGTAIRIGTPAGPTRLIYFPPYDAPYTAHDYAARIDSIVDAVSPSGEVSFLIEPAVETYRRLIYRTETGDFELSKVGRNMLKDSRTWLIEAGATESPGYRKFLDARLAAVNAAAGAQVDAFREALITLFGEANAYDYVDALHVARTYGSRPRNGITRSIRRRTADGVRRSGHVYYPHPDDLDIVSDWQPLVVRSDDDPRRLEGAVTQVEIFEPAVDRVLEEISAAAEEQPFYVPRRLLFVRNLGLAPEPQPGSGSNARVISLPANWLDIYAATAGRQPSGLFLFAIELERVLQ